MSRPRVVLTDACVLINLALAGRLPLLQEFQDLEFRVPTEALAEICRPEERIAVDDALEAGFLRQIELEEPEALALFADLRQHLGIGESACLALATRSDALIASDEKRHFLREAEKRLGPGRLLNTPGLLLLAIRRGAITLEQADEAKELLERHRFRMTFGSFRELVEAQKAP